MWLRKKQSIWKKLCLTLLQLSVPLRWPCGTPNHHHLSVGKLFSEQSAMLASGHFCDPSSTLFSQFSPVAFSQVKSFSLPASALSSHELKKAASNLCCLCYSNSLLGSLPPGSSFPLKAFQQQPVSSKSSEKHWVRNSWSASASLPSQQPSAALESQHQPPSLPAVPLAVASPKPNRMPQWSFWQLLLWDSAQHLQAWIH